jgi:hypothetical protein
MDTRSLILVALLPTACAVPPPELGAFPCVADEECTDGLICDARWSACRDPGLVEPDVEEPRPVEVDPTPTLVVVEEIGGGDQVGQVFALEATGDGLLLLHNDGCASARVSLNGERVIRPRDLNPHVERVERSVNLVEHNRVEVEVRSSPRCSVSLMILAP